MHKILVGACIKQEPVVLQYYLKSLAALLPPKDAELRFGFINDGDAEQLALLNTIQPAVVLPAEPRPADAAYAIGVETHHWTVPTFEHLARQKQRLLDYAVEAGYSHVFLVDSDLLLEPTTLQSLWHSGGNIVNGVFWTRWVAGGPVQPQCWLSHPYTLAGFGMEEHDFLGRLANREVVRCAGGGACTLIATKALKRGVHYHPRLANLPQEGMWQGEDRTFALLAGALHERQLADSWPDIFHAYHPGQRRLEVLAEIWNVLSAPRQERAGYGDLVSIVLEPLEDAQVAAHLKRVPELGCVRGRLGALPLAPELEAALTNLKVGEQAMVDVRFMPWSQLTPYRGTSKIIRMHLVDCKPYGAAPVLHEEVFGGLDG